MQPGEKHWAARLGTLVVRGAVFIGVPPLGEPLPALTIVIGTGPCEDISRQVTGRSPAHSAAPPLRPTVTKREAYTASYRHSHRILRRHSFHGGPMSTGSPCGCHGRAHSPAEKLQVLGEKAVPSGVHLNGLIIQQKKERTLRVHASNPCSSQRPRYRPARTRSAPEAGPGTFAELGGEPGRPCARLPARSPSARPSQAPARFPPVGPGPPPARVPSARPSPLLRPPAPPQRGPLFLKARLS